MYDCAPMPSFVYNYFKHSRRQRLKVTRLYTGKDGNSHFEDLDIPLDIIDGAQRYSKTFSATGMILRETEGSYDLDFHPAPRRQFVINLEGKVELIVPSGDKRILGPGDILLAEDTTGKGHISKSVNNQPRKSIYVTLD
jgi:hypothetical protein